MKNSYQHGESSALIQSRIDNLERDLKFWRKKLETALASEAITATNMPINTPTSAASIEESLPRLKLVDDKPDDDKIIA